MRPTIETERRPRASRPAMLADQLLLLLDEIFSKSLLVFPEKISQINE